MIINSLPSKAALPTHCIFSTSPPPPYAPINPPAGDNKEAVSIPLSSALWGLGTQPQLLSKGRMREGIFGLAAHNMQRSSVICTVGRKSHKNLHAGEERGTLRQ